jgi:hypothetical protein
MCTRVAQDGANAGLGEAQRGHVVKTADRQEVNGNVESVSLIYHDVSSDFVNPEGCPDTILRGLSCRAVALETLDKLPFSRRSSPPVVS